MSNIFSRSHSEELKVLFAIIAVLLTFLTGWWANRPRQILWQKIVVYCLWAILGLFSFLGYSRMLNPEVGFSLNSFRHIWAFRVDGYDLAHYYLTPKYFDELSYFRLYPAMIRADMENDGPYFKYLPSRDYIVFQDRTDYFWVRSKSYMQDKDWQLEETSLFSESRWQEFTHDFLEIQRGSAAGMTRDNWNNMLWDHGFNGTPAWVGFANWLTNLVPVENLKILCLLDPLLLMLSIGFVAWGFGILPALIYFAYFFFCYSSRWPTLSMAFGRYDYVSFLVIATCLLKKNKLFLAGICGGWAGCLRIFPTIWFTGIIVSFISDSTARRSLYRIFIGALLITCLSWGYAAYRFGTDDLVLYFKKMAAHTSADNLSSMREGFALALAYDADVTTFRIDQARRDTVDQQKTARGILTLILLGCFAVLVRKLPLHEQFAYGFIPFFLVFTASYYYYIVRSTLIVMHAGDLKRPRHFISLCALLSIEVLSISLATFAPLNRVMQIGLLGWALTAYVFLSLFLISLELKNVPQEPQHL